LAEQFFRIGVAHGDEFAVPNIVAKHIDIAVQEPAPALVEHIECLLPIDFHLGDHIHEHGLRCGFICQSLCLLSESHRRKRKDCARRRSNDNFAYHVISSVIAHFSLTSARGEAVRSGILAAFVV
jgi:hypothetical protein